MRPLSISLLLLLYSCSVITLPAKKNQYGLPLVRGIVSYQKTLVTKGIKSDEFYRAAHTWFQENKDRHSLEWERPLYRLTLLNSAIIPPSRISNAQANHYSNRTVHYLITVEANDDSCRVLLSNFEVVDTTKSRFGIEIEKLAYDKELCESINREGWAVVESLSQHIRNNTEKPF